MRGWERLASLGGAWTATASPNFSNQQWWNFVFKCTPLSNPSLPNFEGSVGPQSGIYSVTQNLPTVGGVTHQLKMEWVSMDDNGGFLMSFIYFTMN